MNKKHVGVIVAVACAILVACGAVYYAMQPNMSKGFPFSFFKGTIRADEARDNLEGLIGDSDKLAIDDVSIVGNTLVVSVSETSFIDAQTSLNIATQKASELVQSFDDQMATEYVTWIEKNQNNEVNVAYTIKSVDVVTADSKPEDVLDKAESYSLSPDVHRVIIKFVPEQIKGEVKNKDAETVEATDDDTNSPWSQVKLTNTYRTQATKLGDTPVKQLEFSYPDGWEVREHYLYNDEEHPDESISLIAPDNTSIYIYHVNVDTPPLKTSAVVEKITSSSLNALDENADSKYMIAKVLPKYGLEYKDPDNYDICLIPEMEDGTVEFGSWQFGGVTFKYDVYLTAEQFYFMKSSEQTINEAIAILKSLRAVDDSNQ